MIVLYCLLGVLGGLFLLLLIPIRLALDFDGELSVRLRYLFLCFRLYPRKEKKKKKPEKGLFSRSLVRITSVAVLVGCVVLIAFTERDCAQKKEEMVKTQSEIDEIVMENSDLERILESDDMSAYLEEVAFERGYAYPDERRFYDTTRD